MLWFYENFGIFSIQKAKINLKCPLRYHYFLQKLYILEINFYIQLKSLKNCPGMWLQRNHTRENKDNTKEKEAKCPLRYCPLRYRNWNWSGHFW